MIAVGSVFHAATGFLIALGLYKLNAPVYVTVCFLLTFAYFLKEMGEAKSKTVGQGKITSVSRNVAMLKYVFQPKVIVQWVAAGVGAAIAWVI